MELRSFWSKCVRRSFNCAQCVNSAKKTSITLQTATLLARTQHAWDASLLDERKGHPLLTALSLTDTHRNMLFIPHQYFLHSISFPCLFSFSPIITKSSHRVPIPRRRLGKELRLIAQLSVKDCSGTHETLDERVSPSHLPRSTQIGEVHTISFRITHVLLVLFVLTYLQLPQLMSPKMLAPKTHLKTLSPKLDTMSHQTYGTIQLIGSNTKKEHIRGPPRDSAMLNVYVSKKDTESFQKCDSINRHRRHKRLFGRDSARIH